MNRLHLRLRRGERRKCLYKEQTSWRQEGRNEKAAWKEQIRADIWTLNPAHHWAPWPQRLSHNSDRGENRHTFQRWWRRRRRRRKSRLRWNTGLWEPHDKRLLLASMWGGSLCGRELLASVPHGPSFKAMWGDGRGRWGGCSSPSQEGHPRTRPQHQTEEPEWQRAPNLSVPYIPEPHAAWKGKQPVANLDLHCRPGTQHPPPPPPTPRTHSWHTGASLHRRGWRLRSNTRGDYQSRKPASVSKTIWETKRMFARDDMKTAAVKTTRGHKSASPACHQHWRAVVNKPAFASFKSKGQSRGFTSATNISINTLTQGAHRSTDRDFIGVQHRGAQSKQSEALLFKTAFTIIS